MARGRFISFEGVDGAGKSTQVRAVAAAVEARGLDFIVTREPGGTPLGEAVRALVLGQYQGPHRLSQRRAARLAGDYEIQSAGLQGCSDGVHLGTLAGAIDAFEGNESAARHGPAVAASII